jgi:hypothetical protein
MNRDEVDILMGQLYARMDEINLSITTPASDETEVPTETKVPIEDFSKSGR